MPTSQNPWPEILAGIGRVTWTIIRIPMLATLVVLEPIVSLVCAGIAVLGILTALFFRLVSTDPRFPFWGMLAVSVGFAVALYIYEAAILRLSR